MEHDQLSDADVLCTAYSATRAPLPNALSLIGFDKRLVKFPDAVHQIKSHIHEERRRKSYDSVAHVGHSLGGHIALHVASALMRENEALTQRIALINPPNKAIFRAKLWNTLTLGTNQHTKMLSNNEALRENIVNLVADLRSGENGAAIPVSIIQGTADAVVEFDDELYADNVVALNAGHNWFKKVRNPSELKFRMLLNSLRD